jgi:hypothetical protein
MAWADVARHEASRKVLLAEIEAGQRLTAWTVDGSFTNSWSADSTYRIVDVEEDGTGLTERPSLAICDFNDGSFFWDPDNAKLWVNPTASDPHEATIIATVRINYGNFGKVFDSVPYFARVKAAPAVSLRIPERFDGIGQVGGGALNLANEDAALDVLRSLDLDGRTITLKLGLDL